MAGLKRAKAQGKTLGRPKVDEAAILRSLRKGVGIRVAPHASIASRTPASGFR